ncbi:hypothetical protein MBANPS3_012379 [Mucor bainieri]
MIQNPNDSQQDPMSFKAARMVYQLVESTERFLITVGEFNSQSISGMGNNINDYITRIIEQYEHVCMIVNALQAITLCVGDPQNRNSLSTAATSASTSSTTALSRVYAQLLSLQIDDTAAKENLSQLALLVQQSKLVNVKLEESSTSNAKSQALNSPPPPSTQDIDSERRELALKRKQFDEEREEFERERKRLLLDKEAANQRIKEQLLIEQQEQQRKLFVQQQQQQKEQQQQQQQQQKEQQQQQQKEQQQLQHQEQLLRQQKEQQQRQQQQQQQQQEQEQRKQQHLQLQQQRHEQRVIDLQKQERREALDKEGPTKQKQQVHVLSTDQFLEQFERTAQTFAQSINMDMDNVWEFMLIHALPKDKVPWANETIIGKKHPWRYAKQMYYAKYAEKNGSAPSSPTGHRAVAGPSTSIPTAPTVALAATNAVAQAATGASSSAAATTTSSAPPTPLQRLLARPAPSATDSPPKERDQRRIADYCQHLLSLEMKFYDTIEQSLDPKYRNIVRTALHLHKQPLNHIKDVMAVAEETINAYIAASPARRNAPYSQNCIHNRKVNQAV